jgi:hypothetical protein
MSDSAILRVDHEQDSSTSLSHVIWDLDYQGSGAYGGPAARELSRRSTSNLALLEYRSAGTDGVLAVRPAQTDPARHGGRPGDGIRCRGHRAGGNPG